MEPTVHTLDEIMQHMAEYMIIQVEASMPNEDSDKEHPMEQTLPLLAMLIETVVHVCLELEQINNNIEALRGDHKGRIGWLDMQGVWHDGLMPLEGNKS